MGGGRQEFPFLIDGKGYTDRDREMFVAGWEFCQVHSLLHVRSEKAFPRPVHSENEFRLRNLVSKYCRTYTFTPVKDDATWMMLEVGPIPHR